MWMALAFIMSRMSLIILHEKNWEDLEDAVADLAADATRVFVNNIRGSSARTNLIIEPGPKMDLQEQLEFLYGDASPVTTLLPNLLQDIWLAYSTLQSRSAEHVTNGRFNLACFDDELYRKMREAFESEEGRAAGAELLADESTFVDTPNSPLWFGREVVVIG